MLLVAEWGGGSVSTTVNHLVSKHAKMGELTGVLLRKADLEPEPPFIQRAFVATYKLQISAKMIMMMDRTMGSAVLAMSYQPWL